MICFSLWFWLWCVFYNRPLKKHIILLSECTSRLADERIHIKLVSSDRTAWTFIWPLIYYALALRKCLKKLNTEPTGPKLFSICFIGAMVCVPLPTFFAVFRRRRTKLMRRENGTKLKNLTFDLNLLLAPTRAHQVFICICFLVVSLFM